MCKLFIPNTQKGTTPLHSERNNTFTLRMAIMQKKYSENMISENTHVQYNFMHYD